MFAEGRAPEARSKPTTSNAHRVMTSEAVTLSVSVAVSALRLLATWASDGSVRHRAERAQAAQAEVARKRATGEGPLVFEGGTPGAPTVGAPEPVGSDLEKTIR